MSYLRAPRLRPLLTPPNDGTQRENRLDLRVALKKGAGHVDEIGQRAVIEFREELGGQYTRFNYAPFLVGGLLRWRLKEPRALLTGNNTLADRLFEVIEAARQDLMSRRLVDEAFARRREKYVPILDGLLDYLRGEGGNPNLLLDIYDA